MRVEKIFTAKDAMDAKEKRFIKFWLNLFSVFNDFAPWRFEVKTVFIKKKIFQTILIKTLRVLCGENS